MSMPLFLLKPESCFTNLAEKTPNTYEYYHHFNLNHTHTKKVSIKLMFFWKTEALENNILHSM